MSYIKIINKNKKNTVVVFSSIGLPKGKFSSTNSLANLDANLLFINCVNNGWYLAPIPGLGKDYISISKILQSHLEKLGSKKGKVLFYGGSMGGYGALLYGSILNADYIFATGVETILGIEGGNFKKKSFFKIENLIVPDLHNIIKETTSKVFLYSGEESEVDLVCLQYLQDCNIQIKTLKNQKHSIPPYIDKNFGLKNIIEDFLLQGETFRMESVEGDILEYDFLIEILYKFSIGKITLDTFINKTKSIFEELSDTVKSYIFYKIGYEYIKLKDYNKSEYYMLYADERNKQHGYIQMYLAEIYFQTEQFEKSLDYSNRAIKLSDKESGKALYNAYFTAALANIKLKNTSSALKYIDYLSENLSKKNVRSLKRLENLKNKI